MDWYYAEGETRHGPVDDARLSALVAEGTVGPETLVWREGMADWQAYRDVAADAAPAPSAPASAAEPDATPHAPPSAEPTAAKWYYAEGQKRVGPVDDARLKELAAEGTVRPETLVWREGMPEWRPYRETAAGDSEAGPWYYAEGRERRGPVDGAALKELAAAGTVQAGTLVWRKGMGAWQPYGRAVPLAVPAGHGACRECGKILVQEDLIRYESCWVCAECKPVFFQKIREGGRIPGDVEYAGFWIRLGAYLIDWIILTVVNWVVGMAIMVGTMALAQGAHGQPLVIFAQLFQVLVQFVIQAAFSTWFIGKYAATPGKMACRLKVVTAEGEKVTYARALARHLAKYWLSMVFTLSVGCIIAAFDDQKRALHDRICNTRVVRK